MANEFSIAVLFKLIDELTKPMQKMGLAVQNQGKKISEAGDKFVAFGSKASLLVTAPIVALGTAIVKNTADMEMYQSSFETMLGSVDRAKKMMSDLQEFAAKTPFEFTTLAQGTKTLLGFGVEAEKIMPTIGMLGDVAQGNADKMQSLSLVYGQIMSTGRLMGQDLLQLINAGFNPLQVISKKTGESMASLKDKMSKGGISAQMVADAFKTATSEGGMFYKGMDRASKTFSGLWSTLMDDLATFGRQFGEVILPVAKDFVKDLSKLIKGFGDLDIGTRKLIIGLALGAAAIGPLSVGIGGLMKSIGGMIEGLGWLMKHPIILALVGIAAAVTAIVFAVNAFNNRFNDAKTKIDENRGRVEKLSTRYNELQAKVNKTNAEYHEMSSLQAQLIAINPGFAASINKTTGELDLSAKHLKEYNNELDRNKMLIIDQQLKEATKAYGQAVKDIDDVAKNKWMAPDVKKGIIQEAIERKKNADLKMKELIVEKDSIKGKKDETKATADLTNALADANDNEEQYLENYISKNKSFLIQKQANANVAAVIKKTGNVELNIKVSAEKGSSALIQKVSKQGDINTNIITDSYLGLAGI